jgi:hypothetical protein
MPRGADVCPVWHTFKGHHLSGAKTPLLPHPQLLDPTGRSVAVLGGAQTTDCASRLIDVDPVEVRDAEHAEE